MRTITVFECGFCGCRYHKPEDAIKCESKCLSDGIKTNTFIKVGTNRREAYDDFVKYESMFDEGARNDLTFKEFCMELDKGYGESDCIQVARLIEDDKGMIFYDNEYCG